jgi:PAS domain S-box-containing protein
MKSFFNSGKKIENVFLFVVFIFIITIAIISQEYQRKINYNVYRKTIIIFSDILTSKIQDVYSEYYKTNLQKIYETVKAYNLEKVGLESLIIYNCDWKKKFDLSDFSHIKNDFMDYLTIFEKDNHNIQEQKIQAIKDLSGRHLLIINPIQNDDGEKIANIYFVFNYHRSNSLFRLYNAVFYIFIFSLIVIIIFFTNVYRKHQIKQIFAIEKYISDNLKKISSYGHQELEGLEIVYPYSFIQRKIVFCITQYNEMFKKNIKLVEQNSQLIENAPISIIILNEFGNIIYFNEKAAIKLGFTERESLINYSFYNFFILKKENNRVKELVNNLEHGVETVINSTLLTIKNKKVTMVISFFKPNENDNTLCYLIDVSELFKSEIKKMEVLKKKSSLVENMDDSLIEYDDSFKITDFNSKFQNLFHKTSKELKENNLFEVFKDDLELSQLFENITLYEYNKHVNFFSSNLNKWLLFRNNKLVIDNESSNIVAITDISSLMKDKVYHEMIMNELDGFIFIEDNQNKILYLSKSFELVTGFDKKWFIKNKTNIINAGETMIIIKTNEEEMIQFEIKKSYLIESKNTIYLCLRNYEI